MDFIKKHKVFITFFLTLIFSQCIVFYAEYKGHPPCAYLDLCGTTDKGLVDYKKNKDRMKAGIADLKDNNKQLKDQFDVLSEDNKKSLDKLNAFKTHINNLIAEKEKNEKDEKDELKKQLKAQDFIQKILARTQRYINN